MLTDVEKAALLAEFKKELTDDLDDRYVLQNDCNDRQTAVAKKFANDDTRISVLVSDFSTIKKLIWAIATASIGSLVAAVFELILRA